jgi:hypothetical protein
MADDETEIADFYRLVEDRFDYTSEAEWDGYY